MAQLVKNLPVMQEIWVQSLGQEDLLEKEMATHSSILPGESRGQRSLMGYCPWGHDGVTNTFTFGLSPHIIPSLVLLLHKGDPISLANHPVGTGSGLSSHCVKPRGSEMRVTSV